MPEMDGASFVRALRSRPALVDVPIIVITVYQDREFCYRALEAGATDFLLSPVDHLEFRARARNLLTLRRQQLLLAERAADLERELHTQNRRAGAGRAAAGAGRDAGRRLGGRRAGPPDAGQSCLRATARHRPQRRRLGRPLLESHSEEYALQSGVLDEKVLETGLAIGCTDATTR